MDAEKYYLNELVQAFGNMEEILPAGAQVALPWSEAAADANDGIAEDEILKI